ncbi:MAG: hypothetical protein J5449_03390 [Oscillospiraceae bacterium]|nr:hypothetical protein [Oscillospiraceae bacterium]
MRVKKLGVELSYTHDICFTIYKFIQKDVDVDDENAIKAFEDEIAEQARAEAHHVIEEAKRFTLFD